MALSQNRLQGTPSALWPQGFAPRITQANRGAQTESPVFEGVAPMDTHGHDVPNARPCASSARRHVAFPTGDVCAADMRHGACLRRGEAGPHRSLPMKAFLFGCLPLVVVHATSFGPLRAAEDATTRASLDLLLVIDCGRSKHRSDVTRRATECLDCLRPGDRVRAFSCGPKGASLRFGHRFTEHDRKTLTLMLSSATPQRKLLGFLDRRADLAKGLQHVLGVLNSDGAAPGIKGSTKAVVLVTDAIRDEELAHLNTRCHNGRERFGHNQS